MESSPTFGLAATPFLPAGLRLLVMSPSEARGPTNAFNTGGGIDVYGGSTGDQNNGPAVVNRRHCAPNAANHETLGVHSRQFLATEPSRLVVERPQGRIRMGRQHTRGCPVKTTAQVFLRAVELGAPSLLSPDPSRRSPLVGLEYQIDIAPFLDSPAYDLRNDLIKLSQPSS